MIDIIVIAVGLYLGFELTQHIRFLWEDAIK